MSEDVKLAPQTIGSVRVSGGFVAVSVAIRQGDLEYIIVADSSEVLSRLLGQVGLVHDQDNERKIVVGFVDENH